MFAGSLILAHILDNEHFKEKQVYHKNKSKVYHRWIVFLLTEIVIPEKGEFMLFCNKGDVSISFSLSLYVK